ncbi:hypothetical protein EV383_5600 [Pseudonocardia sediminis]|uniref:Cytochrome P450 n=1 Tax=Pseudonocardia sediminis TaxID=1397368 RepID=A0A4Q7V2Q8_PSEST|nr:hypothetical protein EV383_5600 [Pseudonocardia sediminis]
MGPLPDGLDPDRTVPVRSITLPDGRTYWSVADHALARRVLSDPRFSREAAVAPGTEKLMTVNPSADSIISMDGARHTRIRRLIAGAFTERRVAEFRPAVERFSTELLDRLADQGPPADLVAHYSSRLSLSVLCHVLGVPLEDEPEFRSLVPVLFQLDGDETEGRRKAYLLAQYMNRLVTRKRRHPGRDLLTTLVEAGDDGDRLSSRELVTLSLALLMAGYDTTGDQITLAVLAVLLDPQRRQAVTTRPDEVPELVEDLLRHTPSTPLSFTRVATEDVELGDVLVARGESVVVFAMGANRSPGSGPGPAPRHLTFGYGPHRCVGAPLARLQLVSALRGIGERLPGLTLAEDPENLPWKPVGVTRGLSRMRVTW